MHYVRKYLEFLGKLLEVTVASQEIIQHIPSRKTTIHPFYSLVFVHIKQMRYYLFIKEPYRCGGTGTEAGQLFHVCSLY